MKKEYIQGITIGIIVAVIGGLLLIIFGAPIQDFLDSPAPIKTIAYDSETVCPNILEFPSFNSSGIATGKIIIKVYNSGDKGTLYLNLFSNNVLSKSKKFDNFKKESKEQWFAKYDSDQEFKFDLILNQSISDANIKFYFTLGCYENIGPFISECDEIKWMCEYKKQDQHWNNNYAIIYEGE